MSGELPDYHDLDRERRARGQLVTSYSVFCGCADWVGYGNTKAEVVQQARDKGWKLTRKYGWVCPSCRRTF